MGSSEWPFIQRHSIWLDFTSSLSFFQRSTFLTFFLSAVFQLFFSQLLIQTVIPSLKQIRIYTDSIYVKEGITVWIANWEKNNWKTADKKNVKNVDLWKKLKELVKSSQIEWIWVKGHYKDPMNDLADSLAKKATPI